MSETKNNLELWNSVQQTDPKHTKKANVGGNKITAIKPQYQILKATEKWGAYGSKWGLKDINLSYDLLSINLVVFKASFYYPDGEFEIINSIKLYKDNAKTMVDDDFAKKIETDALTKALSKLGFNADVFMGRFDDVRYVDEMDIKHGNKEAPKPKATLKEAMFELDGITTEDQRGIVWNKHIHLKDDAEWVAAIKAKANELKSHETNIKNEVKNG
jgi:hypothetical protein